MLAGRRSRFGLVGRRRVVVGAGREIHVISMMRTRIYEIGEAVSVEVSPHHCHLIPSEAAD